MTLQKILVKRYLRRSPKTPEGVVRGALRTLRHLKADGNLKYACRIQVTEKDSQVIPDKRLGFRRNSCTVINIGDNDHVSDIHDEVEAAAAIYHEAVHAKDIAKKGSKGVSQRQEIKAHEDTIEFLKDWKKVEKREQTRKRIDEVIRGDRDSIDTLRTER